MKQCVLALAVLVSAYPLVAAANTREAPAVVGTDRAWSPSKSEAFGGSGGGRIIGSGRVITNNQVMKNRTENNIKTTDARTGTDTSQKDDGDDDKCRTKRCRK